MNRRKNKHKRQKKISRESITFKVPTKSFIKFKLEDFRYLRARLLEDLSKEHYAVLLGKSERIGKCEILKVYDLKFLSAVNYEAQSLTFLQLRKDFVHGVLAELTNRLDIDTIIDVHSHPFSKSKVSFSGVDDNDEKTFFRFLNKTFDGLHYASIVLSQTEYSARVWGFDGNRITSNPAIIKTQTKPECIPSSDFTNNTKTRVEEGTVLAQMDTFFNRSVLALGQDVMQQIMSNQVISVVGVGGLGSIVAEHLVHMGFHYINLIDHDVLEISNLNRIVGAYYEDAKQNVFKVDVVKNHLEKINPYVNVSAYSNDVFDKEIEEVIAFSDWILITTDNHSSRFRCQQLSVKYFVPLISAGVNITVDDNKIKDMSGEVITARIGDCLCLNCLKRINSIKVASERHPDENIRKELVNRGYVTGMDIKEPAVKTLNSFLATMLVDVLINQYTNLQKHTPILVYENNKAKSIYEDKESVRQRNKNCFTCNV